MNLEFVGEKLNTMRNQWFGEETHTKPQNLTCQYQTPCKGYLMEVNFYARLLSNIKGNEKQELARGGN